MARGQVPATIGEAQQLLLSGDSTTLYVEACKGRTCCLRALNVLTGKQRWGICLAAEQGEDATHPRPVCNLAGHAITIGSICLLILGACMVYVHRWREERALLFADEAESPRHAYRPCLTRRISQTVKGRRLRGVHHQPDQDPSSHI